ncbi:MAG: CDP-diacylglycerol--serine O-phosphatidyltransferase [Pseudomonadota bacterium]
MKAPFPDFLAEEKKPTKSARGDAAAPEDLPHLFDADQNDKSASPPDDGTASPDAEPAQISRLRDVPLRMLAPNLITLGAICSGLTSIRLAWESRFELAIAAIVFAAILDALDGRVARFLKSSTSFGEQLDSLADFVNFGVAPALVLYLWGLNALGSIGWVVALAFAICGCLRLARFNVMLEAENEPEWAPDFFTGVPAPAGALLMLLPVYLSLILTDAGKPDPSMAGSVSAAIYAVFVGFLMVSNLPTWSGKRSAQNISRNLVFPFMIGLLLLITLLFSFPWWVLSLFSGLYLVTIPFSIRDHRKRVHALDAGKQT